MTKDNTNLEMEQTENKNLKRNLETMIAKEAQKYVEQDFKDISKVRLIQKDGLVFGIDFENFIEPEKMKKITSDILNLFIDNNIDVQDQCLLMKSFLLVALQTGFSYVIEREHKQKDEQFVRDNI
tara:strand:+ start:702 stop:1076 length:375 start_codon:yes stop_codon:yes gene_type:complete